LPGKIIDVAAALQPIGDGLLSLGETESHRPDCVICVERGHLKRYVADQPVWILACEKHYKSVGGRMEAAGNSSKAETHQHLMFEFMEKRKNKTAETWRRRMDSKEVRPFYYVVIKF
jgi:hypothetical protein